MAGVLCDAVLEMYRQVRLGCIDRSIGVARTRFDDPMCLTIPCI
jgi:hypothetical protein